MGNLICDDRLDMNKLIKYIKSLTDEEYKEFMEKDYSDEQLLKMGFARE